LEGASEEMSEVRSEVMLGVGGRSERGAVGRRRLMPRSSREVNAAVRVRWAFVQERTCFRNPVLGRK